MTQGQTAAVSSNEQSDAKIKSFLSQQQKPAAEPELPIESPHAVVEQGGDATPPKEVTLDGKKIEKTPKKPKATFAVLDEPNEDVVKDVAWWEAESSRIQTEAQAKIDKYEKVFNKPYFKKFLEAEEENKDVWSELENMVQNNPNKMSNTDVYRSLLKKEGMADEDDIEYKIENYENMSAFDQKMLVKEHKQELVDNFNKGRNNYDIDKFYDKNKPDEKTVAFVTELLDSVLSNEDKHVPILADYKQTAEITKKIEKALKSGIDGGYTAGLAKTPQEAYTNLVMMLDQKNFMKHIQNAALSKLEEGQFIDAIDGIKARPLVRAGEVMANGVNLREAIKGGIRRE